MSSRYSRNISPPGRRNLPPERASTGHVGYPSPDQYYNRSNRDTYTSPRSSAERVIPISSETYVNGVPVSGPKAHTNYDQYSDYGRRSNLASSDALQRHGSLSSGSNRSRPNAIQSTNERPSSPLSKSRHDKDNYTSAAVTNNSRREHKKIYSIDDGKPARLIEDRDRNERDREGNERNARHDPRAYYLNSPDRSMDVDEHGGYEYTDARGMYRDTEPRWRPRRQGSVDTADRARPTSMVDSNPRASTRVLGPPPATKGLDKVQDGVTRQTSLREDVRPVTGSRDRELDFYSQDDTYDVRPRTKGGRGDTSHHDRLDIYSPTRDHFDDSRDFRRSSRRFEDQDVASRGFGIRATSVEPDSAYDESYDRRSGHSNGIANPVSSRRDQSYEKSRDSPRSDVELKHREKHSEQQRDLPRDKNSRLASRDIDKGEGYNESRKGSSREHDRYREYEDRYSDEERPLRDQRTDQFRESERLDKTRGHRRTHHDEGSPSNSNSALAATAGIAGVAAYEAQHLNDKFERDRYRGGDDQGAKDRKGPASDSTEEDSGRERHYIRKDDYVPTDSRAPVTKREEPSDSIDPDEDYRRRIQKEVERTKQSKPNVQSSSGIDDDSSLSRKGKTERQTDEWKEQDDVYEKSKGYEARDEYDHQAGDGKDERFNPKEDDNRHSRALTRMRERHEGILNEPLTNEPAQVIENRENRVSIVEPPKEKEMPKGILRKPTEKFPEHPSTEREGVAPLKDATKKGIPAGARWTKIDRRLVNPEALEEAKERFEERQDCVIVLRVLTKEEIQKFADRTRDIRDERYERDHKDRKQHHGKDKARKDHDGAYDSYEEDEERDQPRQIGWH